MAVVTKKKGSTLEVTGVHDELEIDVGDVSDEIDPGVDLSSETHMNLLFKINADGAWGAGDKIADVYLIETVQDSDASSTDREEHYETPEWSAPTFPQESFVGSIVAVDNTLNEYYILRDVPIPAYKFKIAVHNTHDQTFDGLEINLQPWQYEIA